MAQMNDPHHLQKMREKEMQRRTAVDPATIIDWPTGLRCVMKTVTMNEKVIAEIKKVCDFRLMFIFTPPPLLSSPMLDRSQSL